MNIYDFSNYVNQDVDDTFTVEEVARFFNKAVANFNLIPPVTKYPFINLNLEPSPGQEDTVDEFVTLSSDTDASDGFIGAYTEYPFSTTFMLAVILPYVISAVKGQESSVTEKQLALQEFMMNARQYKGTANIFSYLENQQNSDLDLYQIGENVYLTDFTQAPFAGDWTKATIYKEVSTFTDKNGVIRKVVDDSRVEEDWQTIIDEEV
jgi:hypothetical protein